MKCIREKGKGRSDFKPNFMPVFYKTTWTSKAVSNRKGEQWFLNAVSASLTAQVNAVIDKVKYWWFIITAANNGDIFHILTYRMLPSTFLGICTESE